MTHSRSDDCVFCAIVAREAPATIVREWDDALAIVPLNPVTPGHTLVLPKRHVQTIFSDPDTSAATMRRVAEMLHGVERHHEPRDHNVITSAGEWATQTIMHLHVHIVPRERGDGLMLPWSGCTVDLESLSARLHDIYQAEAHRRGDIRHADRYDDLAEPTKEWDRVLARWVLRHWTPKFDGSDDLPPAVTDGNDDVCVSALRPKSETQT